MDATEFYQLAELKDNPFRQNPDLEDDPRADLWANFDIERDHLIRFMEKCTRENARSTFILLYGDWGTGKSHALLWARHQVLHKRAADFNSAAYYIRTLKAKSQVSFADAFMHFVVQRSRYLSDLLSFAQWLKERIAEYKAEHHLGPEVTYDDVVHRLYLDVDYRDVAKKIIAAETREALSKKLEFEKNKDYQAMSIFATTAKLFTHVLPIRGENMRFKNAVYLLIDELDDLDRAGVKERLTTNDLLRDLYDSIPTNFCLIGGISLAVSDLATVFPPYVMQRIKKKILMGHFRASDAKEFVANLLELYRTDGAVQSGFYPFEELVVDAVIGRLPEELLTPRKIIETFDSLLDDSLHDGFDLSAGPINLQYLESKNFIDDALES